MSTTAAKGVSQWVELVKDLLTNRRYFIHLAVLIVIGDAILTQLVIRLIPYTEIDWETYMIHIKLYLNGERDYSKITGPTGPLVYPAGHVWIFRALYALTDGGKSIAVGQQIYAVLYLISLIQTCAIYYKAGEVPNYLLLLLPLSKRLHSIYVLRLFNDCWSAIFAQSAILLLQSDYDDLAAVLLSGAISVKMSALLYLPGLIVILVRKRGILATIRVLATVVSVQVLLALPFLQTYPREYLHNAFDLSRVFLYKWTVNWRFVDEEKFLSSSFAKGLLFGQLVMLILFGLTTWCHADGGAFAVVSRALRRPDQPAGMRKVTSNEIAAILFTSNLTGIVFARSLHYQFYSWYAQQIPFLAWSTDIPILSRLMTIASLEFVWNVYPSTPSSSAMLCINNAVLMLGIWAKSLKSLRPKAAERKSE